MGLILEYEGKELFKKHKITIFPSILANTVDEAKDAAKKLGFPVAVKAQVLTGGRGKKGWIKLAKSTEEVEEKFKEMSTSVKNHYGREFPFLIEKGADIKQEIFISMLIDADTLETLVLFSLEGGVDIETLAKERPEAIENFRYEFGKEVYPYHFMSGLGKRGLTGRIKVSIAKIISTLVNMMKIEDLQLAEINPLVITGDDQVVALDARIVVDDDATFRHPERENYLSEELRYTKEEADAKEHGLAYVDLGGDIGLMSCGAGMGMCTADLIAYFGKETGMYPRNFLDVGGGASPEKVEQALRIIVGESGLKSILINAFGGITRLDDVAKGIIEAKKKYNIEIPMVIRLMGTNQKEGVALLNEAGLEAFEEMEPAIQKAVALAKED
ncbi:MAG: Succinyl-CoA ligase [ADP-forming] subunit beta [Candidatus Heimdallarchaeota archaeon LC_3]|nr:MAG: Succinyl-CoA ligase [ADP-forming] subunit beta [Candidatus Heimdallarchaeota archaeon LC_3]